jgi:hypothetical protein
VAFSASLLEDNSTKPENPAKKLIIKSSVVMVAVDVNN